MKNNFSGDFSKFQNVLQRVVDLTSELLASNTPCHSQDCSHLGGQALGRVLHPYSVTASRCSFQQTSEDLAVSCFSHLRKGRRGGRKYASLRVVLTLLTLGAISLSLCFLLYQPQVANITYVSAREWQGSDLKLPTMLGQLHRRPLVIPRRRWHGSTLLSGTA